MSKQYPDPCVGCTQRCNSGGIGCNAWRIRYLYRQKQINAYARKAFSGELDSAPAAGEATHFCYPHPNDVRRYLHTSPCTGCGFEKDCVTPCGAYLRWWDERMKWFRRKL